MKKRNIFVLLLMICFVVPVFTACGSNPNNNNQTTTKIEIDYIKNLQLAETNSTAYGIKKSSVEEENTTVAQSSLKQFADTSFITLTIFPKDK